MTIEIQLRMASSDEVHRTLSLDTFVREYMWAVPIVADTQDEVDYINSLALIHGKEASATLERTSQVYYLVRVLGL